MKGKTLLMDAKCPLDKWGKHEEHNGPSLDGNSKQIYRIT